jgi:hypothetical protein
MDNHRFDAVAKTLAAGTSRRSMVKRLGVGGVAAALVGATGRSVARAQDSATGELCLIPFEMAVRQGPSAGTKFSGVLAVKTDQEGRVDGTFVAGGGALATVAGQATGRAVTLVFDLGQNGVVYGVGGGDADFSSCRMRSLGGPLVGPLPGDAGDWALIRGRLTEIPPVCLAGDPNCPPEEVEPVPSPIPGGEVCPVEDDVQTCIDICTGEGVGGDTCSRNCRAALLC